MKNFYKKGFTLIELLVVIAIIGILSSIVLASLNTARNKGVDAAVKGNVNSIRSQAAIYQDGSSNFGTGAGATVCEDSSVKQALTATLSAGSQSSGCTASTTYPSASYVAWGQLKTDGTIYYCV